MQYVGKRKQWLQSTEISSWCSVVEAPPPSSASGSPSHSYKSSRSPPASRPLVWRNYREDSHRGCLLAWWNLDLVATELRLSFLWGFGRWQLQTSRHRFSRWTVRLWCTQGPDNPLQHWLWGSRRRHHQQEVCADQSRRAEERNADR